MSSRSNGLSLSTYTCIALSQWHARLSAKRRAWVAKGRYRATRATKAEKSVSTSSHSPTPVSSCRNSTQFQPSRSSPCSLNLDVSAVLCVTIPQNIHPSLDFGIFVQLAGSEEVDVESSRAETVRDSQAWPWISPEQGLGRLDIQLSYDLLDADAEALVDASRVERIPAVPIKGAEQQALVGLHRVREQWMTTRTARINALRGLLQEHGLNLPPGAKTAV